MKQEGPHIKLYQAWQYNFCCHSKNHINYVWYMKYQLMYNFLHMN